MSRAAIDNHSHYELGWTSLEGGSPAGTRAEMYVCICHAVTDKDIQKAVDRGACSLFDVQNELPVGGCCGRCEDTAEAVVNDYLTSRQQDNARRVPCNKAA